MGRDSVHVPSYVGGCINNHMTFRFRSPYCSAVYWNNFSQHAQVWNKCEVRKDSQKCSVTTFSEHEYKILHSDTAIYIGCLYDIGSRYSTVQMTIYDNKWIPFLPPLLQGSISNTYFVCGMQIGAASVCRAEFVQFKLAWKLELYCLYSVILQHSFNFLRQAFF